MTAAMVKRFRRWKSRYMENTISSVSGNKDIDIV